MTQHVGTRRFENKTVVVSGAGLGQGRNHAVRFAAEGAHVVAFDICTQSTHVDHPMATRADLDETVRLVSAAGGRALGRVADVRDEAAVAAVFDDAVKQFGGVDVAVANAGIVQRPGQFWELNGDIFRDVVDTNLVGSWHVLKAATRTMLAAGSTGSIVVTGSGASIKGLPNVSSYVASKHALVGLVRSAAREVGAAGIRINLVAPGNVGTSMLLNKAMFGLYVPDVEDPDEQLFEARASAGVPMRIPYVTPDDVSEAVLFLASDAARHVTGVVFPVDGGSSMP